MPEPDPPGDRKEQRRREILLAAKEVFASQGYHAASISDIIAKAGIARGTFYLYFTSKHKVFDSILEEALSALDQRIARIDVAEGAPPPRLQLRESLLRVFEYLHADRNISRLIITNEQSADTEVAERMSTFFHLANMLVASSLEEGIELGLVRPCDTRFVASAVMGLARGMVVHLLENQDSSVESIVDEGLAFAMNGVLTRDRWSE